MSFEVPPSRVTTQRPRWPFAILAIAFVIVGVAIVTRGTTVATLETADASARQAASQSKELAPGTVGTTPSHLPAAASRRLARPLPPQVECVGIAAGLCRRLIEAALGALPDSAPPVAGATIRASLLCDAWLDCPPSESAGAIQPLGSVSFTFEDDDAVAWVDVVGRNDVTATFISPTPRAWVVRWIAATSAFPHN